MIQSREIRVLDSNAAYFGVPAIQLMEHAGKGVADYIMQHGNNTQKTVLLLCGTGNNGGDGFVAARYLAKHAKVTVLLIGTKTDIRTTIAQKNFQKLDRTTITVHEYDACSTLDKLLNDHEIIVDAMLGIGLSGELREPYRTIAKMINETEKKQVVAVDVPTGLGTKTAIKPTDTITFHDIKETMTKTTCGRITIVDIGIPQKAVEYVGPGDVQVYYPRPHKESHKGDNGIVLVIGGGPYIGAPSLTGFAALRTGADLVYIATPKRAAAAITSFAPQFLKPPRLAKALAAAAPNLIVTELTHERLLLPDDVSLLKKLIPKVHTVIIGPGLGIERSTADAVKQILTYAKLYKRSLVIDADAIAVAGAHTKLVSGVPTVLTPHAGEFTKLTGVKLPSSLNQKKKVVATWAKKLGVTLLVKGAVDIISDGYETKLNETHNEAMTVGGTGDVLAGIVGALTAKGAEPFHAARMSAFINGAAGNNAFTKRSYGLIATDIIQEIPTILKTYL